VAIGQVKFFNTTKGFGFIAPEDGGKDVFVHVTAVQAAGLRGLTEGQRVNFDVEPDKRGPKAVNLKLV
jgi:cold shock protein